MKDQDLKNAKKQQAEPENGECRCKHEGKNSDKACGDNDKEHKCCREESGEHEECKCHNHHGHGGTCCHEVDKEAGDGSCQCKHDKNADSDLLKKLDEATAAATKNRDLYMRAVADLENYRRKVQREKEELSKLQSTLKTKEAQVEQSAGQVKKQQQELEQLKKAMDELNARFGPGAVVKASLMKKAGDSTDERKKL